MIIYVYSLYTIYKYDFMAKLTTLTMYMYIYISLNKRYTFPKNLGDQRSEMVSGVLG